MKLPSGITVEETLHGRGDYTTMRCKENGVSVIVKTSEQGGGLFAGLDFGQESAEGEGSKQFKREREREQQAAENSKYFIAGRLEKEVDSLLWIRPYMERSLENKVAFKETLDGAELGAICQAIVKALADLKRFDKSGHGNLKLSNVLLPANGPQGLKLVDLGEANAKNIASDKRALGLIIYQLVNGEFVESDDKLSSVPDDQDWKSLGPAASKWRDLCSELLNVYGRYAEADWQEIESELKSMSVGAGRKLPLLLSILVLLICGAGGFFFMKMRSAEEKVVVDLGTIQGQWLELLDAYFLWGGAYLRSLNDFEDASDQPDFIQQFYDVEKASLPTVVIAQASGQGGSKIQTAPDVVYEAGREVDVLLLSHGQQEDIVRAFELLTSIRQKIEGWAILTELRENNQAFTASGFKFGESKTRELLDSISFENNTLTLSKLFGLQSSVRELGDLQRIYDQFIEKLALLESESSPPFLENYAAWLAEGLHRAESEDPVSHLRELLAEAEAIWDFWQRESSGLNLELFGTEEREMLSQPNFEASKTSLSEWKNLVSQFQIIELPILDEGRRNFQARGREIHDLTKQINQVITEQGLEAEVYDREFDSLVSKFEADTDMPLVAGNRAQFEEVLETRLGELDALYLTVRSRIAEVKPDYAGEIEKMLVAPETLSGPLREAWEAYLSQEVRVLDENSFSDDPQDVLRFIDFRKEHYLKEQRVERYQSEFLSRIPMQIRESAEFAIPDDLISSVDSVRIVRYERALRDCVEEAMLILLKAEDDIALEEVTEKYAEQMRAYDQRLLDYVRLLATGYQSIRDWSLPGSGFSSLREQLSGSSEQVKWGQTAEFRDYRESVESYAVLEEENALDSLLAIVASEERPDFAKYLVLARLSSRKALSYEHISSIEKSVSYLARKVPSSRRADYSLILRNLWQRAFENAAPNVSLRERVLTLSNAYGVKAADLSGESRVYFELFSAISLVGSNEEKYLDQPKLLAEVLNTLASLPEAGSDSTLDAVVREMREVDLETVKATFEDAAFLQKGWSVIEETEEKLVLGWKDHQLTFHLVEDKSGDFYLSQTECSIALFDDWMTRNDLWELMGKSLPDEWAAFLDQGYNAFDDYREGLRIWTISRRGLGRGGIEMSNSWYVVDPGVMDEYSSVEAAICPPDTLSEDLPMQHIGGRLARSFAESMGMSLPTPVQWHVASSGKSSSSGLFWQSKLNDDLSAGLQRAFRQGSFYLGAKVATSGDGPTFSQLLSRVDASTAPDTFKHLAGNVAEYLYDPEEERYSVAGGSALASVAGTWAAVHPLSRRMELTSFSDVGLRLALIAPEQSAYDQYLEILEAYWN